MSRRRVRAVVVGDASTGKTSIIVATCSNIVREDTVAVLPETNLSHLVQHERDVLFTCADTSSDPLLLENTRSAVASADVVLVCFSCSMLGTLENAVTIWLSNVKRWNHQAPVFLVACKEDVQPPTEEQRAVLDRVARSEAAVMGVCSCSALSQPSAAETLLQACNAVLYPMRPLFDHVRTRLRSRARKAFKRVFQLCDIDGDGALSDLELSNFQVLCYGAPFEPGQLEGLKQTVMQSTPSGVTTVGLTLEGFLQLQILTIVRSLLHVCWTMLRRFGYNLQLELSEELFRAAPPRMCTVCVAQLSLEAVEFLSAKFDQCAGAAGCVPLSQLLTHSQDDSSLLQNAPGPRSPLDERDLAGCMVPVTSDGHLKRNGFLALWAYCTLVDPRQAVKAMLYMGYRDNMLPGSEGVVGSTAVRNLLVVSSRRSPTSEALPSPSAGLRVINCLVFGSKGCGKTTLLQRLARRPPGAPLPESLASSVTAANLLSGAGPPPPGGEPPGPSIPPTVLVLIEVPEASASDIVSSASLSAERLARLTCHHAAFFCFDCRKAESLERARAFLVAFSDLTGHAIPVALVACKSDLGMTPSVLAQMQSECAKLELPPAIPCRALHEPSTALVHALVQVAARPKQHLALTPALAAARQQRELLWRLVKLSGLASAAALTLSALLYWSYRV